MKLLRIKDNSQQKKDVFSQVAKLTGKIADKTLEQLEREGVFVFPETVKDAEDITQDQMILQSVNDAYRSGNVMGFLGYGDERLVIESRFCGEGEDFFFQYLLDKVLDFPNVVDLESNANQDNRLFNFLLFLFPYYLKTAMRKGLFKKYIRCRYNDGNVKGTIDVARHIEKNTPFVGNVAYSQREFSYDNYFEEYYATYSDAPTESVDKLSTQKILALWMEFEQHAEHESRLGLLQKLSIMFRFNRNALKLFLRSPELVIPYLQSQFYSVKRRELEDEKQELNRKLEHYAFDAKTDELTQKSLRLFRAELATRYHWQSGRQRFEMSDFRRNSEKFTHEYPVALSTTYSIKGTLSIEHIYDYLIVDEASQVDLATGVLAFSCARNIVIVGDLKQLPNVLTEDDIRTSDAIWQKYSLDERYRFSTHSLLSSALEIWQDAPVTLLREHYRCHPKIINFCNQKFYHGQLIVMTKDHDEPNVLTMYRTTAGNHARGHLNQRQIDVIQQEVLPRLHQQNLQSIGIITPYRDQVTAIRKQLGDTYEVDTVHKFQGREQDAIILTSVDNVITDFVDDPHMLNVAVSRAVHSLAVVTSQDPRNDQTNYGDLTRYIEYNNFEVIQSQVYSVFDMLYQGYAEQRRAYLQKHKRVSEYDSENLMYSVIQEVLAEEAFSSIGCAVHVSLATLVKDYEPLTEEERQYAHNPLTHVDFLLFNQMDKQPVLAIEVDGTGFHEAGSKQAERDIKKNSILKKCAVPLLRLRTDGSGEKEKIRTALKGE